MILPPPAPTLSDRMDDVLRYLTTSRWIGRPKKRGRGYLALTVAVAVGTIAIQIHAAMVQQSHPASGAALAAIPLAAVIDAVFSCYMERMAEWSSERHGPRHTAWRALVVARIALPGIGIVAALLSLRTVL